MCFFCLYDSQYLLLLGQALIISGLASQLASLIFDDNLSVVIREGIPTNKLIELHKAFEDSLDLILAPYLYELLSDPQKNKIMSVCEKRG